MQGLNIATTEALTLVGSETEVYRENIETGAIVMRTAQNAQIDALHKHWQLATPLEKIARLRQF
jgi:uncharacterized protein YdiU (UPF0061 family)